MGGASGDIYRGPPSRSPEEAEAKFRSAIDESRETEHVRNVFISFHVEDEAQVNLLRQQAKDPRFNLEFRDYSVKEPFDEKWKTQCRERIAQTSATICMIGPDTANRPAVIWELEESYRQGKKVIGVRIHRDRDDPIPQPLIDNNAPIIEWDLEKISKLIESG